MHVDCDAFYAQVERERFPHWRGYPIAVVQNGTLCVTSNYRVRSRGAPKMGDPVPMLNACPTIKFAGSNMIRYRAASKAWYNIFQSFPRLVVMKKSIDESYLDLTEEALHRIRTGQLMKLIRQSSSERDRLTALASERFERARQAWMAEDELMLAKGVAPSDLESTGSLRAARLFSKSTDPITELRRAAKLDEVTPIASTDRQQKEQITTHVKPKHLEGLTEEEVEEYCNTVHPIDYCRGDKRHSLPSMLVSADTPVTTDELLPGVDQHPWRQHYVGYVFLDGTDVQAMTNANVSKEHNMPPPSTSESHAAMSTSAATATIDSTPSPPVLSSTISQEDLDSYPDHLPPLSSFAHEDPSDPSHDFLMAVGSQIAFEIRSTLFREMGLTTSAGIAPNCMLAKVASSLNKPNQQSIVRSSIASCFLRDIKLEAISGFGPRACEEVAELGLVTVGDVQRTPANVLLKRFSDKFASYLLDIAQAIDETPVLVHGPPKSIGQSKRQRTQTTEERIILLKWLCEKLMERMLDDEKEFHRRATVFSFSWITTDSWTTISRRCPLPPYREFRSDGKPIYHEMYETAIKMCKANVAPNLPIRCLAIGVSQFVTFQTGKGIAGYFANGTANNQSNDPTQSSSATAGASSIQSNKFDSTPSESPPVGHRHIAKPSSSIDSYFSLSSPSSVSSVSVSPPSLIHPSSSMTPDPVPSRDSLTSSMPSLELSVHSSSLVDIGAQREQESKRRMQQEGIDEGENGGIELGETEEEIEQLFGGSQEQSDRDGDARHKIFAISIDPSSSTPVSSSSSMMICSECGASIPSSQSTEHADFHFAATLQQQIRHQDRIQREKEQQASSSLTPTSQSAAHLKRKKSSSTVSGSMSLDRFMVANSPSAASQQHQQASDGNKPPQNQSQTQRNTPTGNRRQSAPTNPGSTPSRAIFFKKPTG